ncbi:sensory box histidine kinase [Nocardioidaceae bacterium Broad-1]|nr:sensory box histidine kinase [Nocardioidaceae bacterium Broad-1]
MNSRAQKGLSGGDQRGSKGAPRGPSPRRKPSAPEGLQPDAVGVRQPCADRASGREVGTRRRYAAPKRGFEDLPRAPGRGARERAAGRLRGPSARVADLPLPLAHSVYRIVQEALANVRRHSTADRAQVVLRVDRAAAAPYAEVEITDNGRPRHGTSGSGLGLLGVRERAAVRKAEVDIGPRAVQGFRVRVRFPLDSPVTSAGAAR